MVGRGTGTKHSITRWIVAAIVVASPLRPAYAHESADLLGRVVDRELTECSGVVASSVEEGIVFAHNDSGGDPEIYALRHDGRTARAYELRGARALDWEDVARGTHAGGRSLFVGDIGDNFGIRPFVTVYEVREPRTTESAQELDAVPYHFVYEDGPRNAETLLYDARDEMLAVVTKEATGRARVYVPVAALLLAGSPAVLRRVATIDINRFASRPPRGSRRADALEVTAGDVSHAGDRLALRTYHEAFEWRLGDRPLAHALAGRPRRIALPRTEQGEALGYLRDGRALVAISEGERAPIHRVSLTP